jgi:hypothetical protein
MSLRNKRDAIVEFTNLYIEYANLKSSELMYGETSARRTELRDVLSRKTPVIRSYLLEIGESTSMYYSPPPMVGGFAGTIDMLTDAFNPIFDVQSIDQQIIDLLNRGVGRYNYAIENRWKRWMNPLYWIGELIRVPFYLAKWSGFNGQKAERSFLGKAYKLIVAIGALIAFLIEVWNFVSSHFPGHLPGR